jgi:hypothetical protein
LEGEVNPVLAEKIPATIRADMKQFLQTIAREHPNVTIVSEKDLPEQPAGAYQDLTHVTKEVQKEFSEWLAVYLERQFTTNFAAVH